MTRAAADAHDAPGGRRRGPGLAGMILGGWALAALVLLATGAGAIAGLRFPGPDDAMRLLEVRDWIAGQGWFDVAQHRLNHGDFPMHWSRLVDLPLAAAMVPLDALLGRALSTRVAMAAVPLLTLLAIMALAAVLTRRLAGVAAARLAVLLVPLSVPIVFQARPMAIDHHGWQVALALAAAALLPGRPTVRRGVGAGVALAVLLTVSLEGLPIAVAITGVAATAWAWRPARGGFLTGLVWALAATATVLHAATRGPAMMVPACDAMAPAWLAALGVAAAGVTLAQVAAARVAKARAGVAVRLGALAAVGAAAAATLAGTAPACLAGPFATLPPHVYAWWYVLVLEGRPLWEQAPAWAVMTIGLPLAGLAGSVRAWRAARGVRRDRWTMAIALLLAATAIAVLVNRAGATANALAVPGAAALLLDLLTRARAVERVGRRTLATAGALLLASPGQAGALALTLGNLAVPPGAGLAAVRGWHRPACDTFADMRALRTLPSGLVFTAIDLTPEVIATTGHRAIAGGYHRGAAAMDMVMTGFTAAPDAARATILASGADYVAMCPGFNEPDLYRHVAPDGLWARLERGERIGWLRPLPIAGPALAWRVVPGPGAAHPGIAGVRHRP